MHITGLPQRNIQSDIEAKVTNHAELCALEPLRAHSILYCMPAEEHLSCTWNIQKTWDGDLELSLKHIRGFLVKIPVKYIQYLSLSLTHPQKERAILTWS